MNASKNILQSKTLWLNVIGVAAMVVPGLNLNPVTLGYVMAGLNIANRLMTNGPAHLLPAAEAKP